MLSLTVVVGLEEGVRVVGCDVGVRVVGVDDVGLVVYGSSSVEQVLYLCEKGKQIITTKHWNDLQDFVW